MTPIAIHCTREPWWALHNTLELSSICPSAGLARGVGVEPLRTENDQIKTGWLRSFPDRQPFSSAALQAWASR